MFMNISLPALLLDLPKTLRRFFIFCFLTPGQNWRQECVIKFCVIGVIQMLQHYISAVLAPPDLFSSHEVREASYYFRRTIGSGLIAPLIENTLLMLVCRLAIRFRIPDFWTVLVWGLLFGSLHMAVNNPGAFTPILSFWVMTGLYLNWYKSKYAFLIIWLYHGLWNLNVFVCMELFIMFFEYWLD